MRPPPSFRLPPRRPWSRTALILSVAVHGLLLFGWIEGRIPDRPRRPAQLIVLTYPTDGPEAVMMSYQVPVRGKGQAGRRGVQLERRPRRGRTPELPAPAPPEVAATPAFEPPPDTAVAQAPAPIERIGPGLAGGRLWVRPLPLPPKDLAERLSRKSHAELVDSAVTTIVQAFLDSIASDPASEAAELPSWTTKVAGKTFGIDGRNIYIAGLKIPAAILALLPLTGGGNIDQARAYNHLQDLRADLHYAARRAETADEFKRAIREIRARKEREREFERNQRTAPPPETPATP